MRPPLRWISSAEESICEAAMTWRVSGEAGRKIASSTGSTVIPAPARIAVHTCMCNTRSLPAHAYGDTANAAATQATYCTTSSSANIRLIITCRLAACSWYSSSARAAIVGLVLIVSLPWWWSLY
jgi:hypothetical protein